MIQRNTISFLISITLGLTSLLKAENLKVDGSIDNYHIEDSYYEVYVDSSKSETIKTIGNKKFNPFSLPLCENPEIYYWVKFNLDILSEDDKKWVLEVYEHHIDDFTCYIPWKNNTYKIVSTGDSKKYKERDLK